MACSRGRANPNQPTRLRLFADSAGFCQNPGCSRELFTELPSGHVHIGELAHIFAASDAGPRGNTELSEEERGTYENLILLCANCHTIIDKAPDDFPDALIRHWKRERVERLAGLFGATKLASREEVRRLIEPLMLESKHILDEYGPNTDARYDSEGNAREVWTRKMLTRILPNNRKIIAVLDANIDHMKGDERAVLEAFRQHVDDLAARHLEDVTGGRQYPSGMQVIMEGD
ncbi:MAG: hypothetical protein E6G92_05215 [Alphaproteobacteria bacterium]|nr:MAG: hypothetical protein E6G92_05215 [Alphaproteobacteria bacterium]